jgi:hypothetical protein
MYTVADLQADIESMKPRFFDIYILPAFLIWYAMASKDMKKNWRRTLFVSGVYMGFRSFTKYKELAEKIALYVQQEGKSG